MKNKIVSEIRRLILEVCLVIVFTVVSIPLWDYIGNESFAQVADHYSKKETSNAVITNSKKYIYAESFEEAIGEMNMAFITSYEEDVNNYGVYLLLEVGTDYDNLFYSNGVNRNKLSELYESTSDYIYFKIDEKQVNSKETLVYNYYIWTKNLQEDRNIKIKFAVI